MKKFIKTAFIIITVLGVASVIYIVVNSSSNQSSTTQTVSTSVNVGDIVKLVAGDADSVIVAATKSDLDEVIKLANAKDNLGIAEVVLNGKTFLVDRGIQARVIDTAMYVRQFV
jgi:CO dehydrogenase/acetyl-CoA synthase gamma subunit (corrinoid Fe-S protein)